MTAPLHLLVCMAVFTWIVLMLASLSRAKAWTPRGMLLALGNRADMPEPSAPAARLDRASRNTLENFLLFAALVLAAHAAGTSSSQVTLGAQLFVWSRVAFVVIYWAGIPYLRTLAWGIGVAGLGLIAAAMLVR